MAFARLRDRGAHDAIAAETGGFFLLIFQWLENPPSASIRAPVWYASCIHPS